MTDPKLVAMLNAHNAALLSLFATHPEPEKLRAAFSRYSEAHLEVSDEQPEIGGFQQTWTDIFLQALTMRPKAP